MSDGASQVSGMVFERAAEVFGLLSAPVRLRIVDALCAREMNVSELIDRLGVAQANISQHLSLLYRSGMLTRRREGALVYYRVNAEQAPLLCGAVRSVIGRAAA